MDVREDAVVLLAPEHETVPEHAVHQPLVDLLFAGLAARFADRSDVAVHCRLAWFPDRSDTRVRLDPDVFVAFGRPPAARSSWRTWDEDGVVPTVVFEVWSDHDTDADYRRRLQRARRYGVAEVVLVDPFSPGGVTVRRLVPDERDPMAWRTAGISAASDHVLELPSLGIRVAGGPDLIVSDEVGRWPTPPAAFAAARVEAARANAAEARVERLAARLRAAGLDPQAP